MMDYRNNYNNENETNNENMMAAEQNSFNGKKPSSKNKKAAKLAKKIGAIALSAVLFGGVAGGTFQAVNHFAGSTTATATTTTAPQPTSNSSLLKAAATSSSSTSTGTMDVSTIAKNAMPSIVSITNQSVQEVQNYFSMFGYGAQTPQTEETTSCGSGIIVSQDADNLYIATNNHVVEGADSLTVAFSDNTTVSAEIKGTDPSTDLAVIRVALSSIDSDTLNTIKVATLGNSDDLKAGQAAIAIGNALGYGQSVTTGVISALNREVTVSDSNSNTNYTAELIQTSAAINPGNSGGALLNAAGEVIGINSVKYADTSVEGIGYAIPISTAMPIIEDLITKEKVDEADSAYLGIVGVDVTSDVAKTYNMPTGVYVAQVKENSAAEQAGIQKGDIITAFDGKDVSSMEDLSSKLQYYKAGTTVDVTIQRSSNGQYEEQTLSVTLGKKN
mgnify:CR=1 FL=1